MSKGLGYAWDCLTTSHLDEIFCDNITEFSGIGLLFLRPKGRISGTSQNVVSASQLNDNGQKMINKNL